jgi:acyl-CoA thioesterase
VARSKVARGKRAPTSAHDPFDRGPASPAAGIEPPAAGDGRATVRMRVTGDRVDGHATTHGGCVLMLADTAFACAGNGRGRPA